MKKLLSLVLTVAMLLSIGAFAVAEEVPTAEIVWWAFPTFGQKDANDPAGTYEQTLIDAFEAKYPTIKVKLETIDFTSGPEKLVAAIEGNKAPDVLFDAPGRIVEYGMNGVLVPLNDMFTDELKADINNEGLIAACGDGENYWMYPLSSSPFFMAINKEAFEEADALQYVNLEGDRTWTTENYVKAMEALHAAGKLTSSVYCMNQGGDQGTRAFINNLYGGSMANADLTKYEVDSPENRKALELVKKLVDDQVLEFGPDINAGGEIELFVNKTLAMSICWGTSAAKNNTPNMDFTQIWLPFPSDDGTPVLEYLINGFGIFDNKDEARAKAAKLFVQFLCDSEEVGKANVLATGAFPVRTSFGNLYEGNADYELLSAFTKYYGPYYNTMKGFANMRLQWWTMLQAYLSGAVSLDDALNTFQTEANKDL